MILKPGMEHPGFALQDPTTSEISLALVCEFEREALELQRQQAIQLVNGLMCNW